MLFSIIIPVFNRPQEIEELLESLTRQTYKNFETLIIEDGSKDDCKEVIKKFKDRLDLRYFYKENSGQGFSRNYGFDRAKGDYFIVFDSDCLIPSHYLESTLAVLKKKKYDAYGGPDRAHESFTPVQKAISYAMTSPLTTGGIRGNKRHAGRFHPRSFNMGISREVYDETGGYRITRMGEDIEFSIRILEHNFKAGLIPEAYVYHKRRTSLADFFKQLHFFGRARINISRFYPDELKPIHALPAVFTVGIIIYITLPIWSLALFEQCSILFIFFVGIIFTHACFKTRNFSLGILSTLAAIIQLTAYGAGFIQEYLFPSKE